VPVRTCVGCRRKREAADLIRFVMPLSGEAAVGRRLHGRGYYVCPCEECIAMLEKRLRNRFDEEARNSAVRALLLELGRR